MREDPTHGTDQGRIVPPKETEPRLESIPAARIDLDGSTMRVEVSETPSDAVQGTAHHEGQAIEIRFASIGDRFIGEMSCAAGSGTVEITALANGVRIGTALVRYVVAAFADEGTYEAFGPSGEVAVKLEIAPKDPPLTLCIAQMTGRDRAGLRTRGYSVSGDRELDTPVRIRVRPRGLDSSATGSWMARPPTVVVRSGGSLWTPIASVPHPAWAMVTAKARLPTDVALA